MKVLVTGATGRTGSLALKKLRAVDGISAYGFARSEEKAKDLLGSAENFYFGSISDRNSINEAMNDCDALVILTSAQPQVTPPPAPGAPPGCSFEPGGTPEEVDYQGQLNQIDAAKAAGVQHIVLVGSMGGTNENHPLNLFGKILIWKRKAEQYLIDSGIDYTIIRAGGLIDEPGGRSLLVGKNDEMLANPPTEGGTVIPREDVAEVVVQAIQHMEARNKALDVIANASEVKDANDFKALFEKASAGL